MRSWLASPTVAFLSFLATVITIVQAVFIVAKWANKLTLTHVEDKRRRISMAVIWFCFVYAAVIAPLSWSAIVTEAARIGDTGVIGALYPVTVTGLSLAATLVMLVEVKEKRGFSMLPCCAAISGLAFATFIYIAGTSDWTGVAAAAIPSVFAGVLSLVPILSYARLKASAGSGQQTEN